MLKFPALFLLLSSLIGFPGAIQRIQAQTQPAVEPEFALDATALIADAANGAHLLGPVEIDVTSMTLDPELAPLESESVQRPETLRLNRSAEVMFQPTFVPVGQEKPEQDRGLQIQVSP